jgi:hypothetical protein
MTFGRILILILISFEFLNLVGVLKFTLDFSWLGLLVTSTGTLVGIEAIYHGMRKKNFYLSGLPYFLVALGLWLDATGDILHLYGRIEIYDRFMHLVGGGIIMAVALSIFSLFQKKYALPLFLILTLSLGSTAILGDLYEIEEYLEDKLYHGRQVRLGDGPDTADDLMWNLTGGVLAGAVYILVRKKSLT